MEMLRDVDAEYLIREKKAVFSVTGKTCCVLSVKNGPLYQVASITFEGAADNQVFNVPVPLLKQRPLFMCEGKPVYAGDTLVLCHPRADECSDWDYTTITRYLPGSVYNTPQHRGSGCEWTPGATSEEWFRWDPPIGTPLAAPPKEYFTRVVKSLPGGKKLFAGECFGSVEAARAGKAPFNFAGVYKLVEVTQ